MNQTTEGREQETVALVIMDAYSSLVRVIPCKKRGNVLPHILDTITLWGHKPKAIRCDNAQEFVNEKKFQAWRQMNHVALLRVQAHRHRMQGQIENFIRHLKGKIRSIKFLKGIPDRFWPDLAKMYEAIHNFMEARVPTAGEEGTSPIAVAKPTNIKYDPALLLQPPACMVHVSLTKDHPAVKDSSLGPRVFEGIFFGNEHSSPLVRAYIPSLGRLVLANEVKFFPDALPFLEPCFHNMQGFTERDLANFRLPLRPVSSKKSERIAQLKEAVENIPSPPPTQAQTAQKVDAQTQSEDADALLSPPELKELYIDNIPDHQLADFASARQLQLHFPAGRFWDESLGSWTMKCVGTQKLTGRKHVTLEHISGDSAILTRKFQRIKCPLTISSLPRESRDVSLRAALKINFPSAKTLTDLLPYCQVKLPYPLHSGEKQVIQGKQRQATEQIDQIDLNAHLLTVDDIALARLLVKFKKPLHITDGEVVIPTKAVKGKTVELYYEYAKPQEKAQTGERGRMRMTARQEGQQSVRDILTVMHPAAQTLKDIGITMASKALLTQASVKVWGVWAELKELANASHWSDWQTERNAAKFNRDLVGEDAYNPGAERSTDVEETYRVMQVLKENKAQDEDKLAEKKEAEEVDLGYIDLFEPDPAHYRQAHANKKLSPQWKIEEGIEMKGLFDRGCLIKTKRSDLPKGARIVGSRFQYKIKRHHAGDNRLKVKRLKARLVVQGHRMSQSRGDFTDAFSPVPHMSGVRMLQSIATAKGWKHMLVDLTQGFIQADLPKGGKTIYITPPQGWEEDPDTVYEVKKPLYGMPHSGRCLHKTWSQWLKSEGFESVGYEKSMWVKKDGDQQIMLCTHVDDSFVTASSEAALINFRNRMLSTYGGRFDGTADMDAKEYVGMEWERDVKGNTSKLHQSAFCEKLLKDFGFWQCARPAKTPEIPGARLSIEDSPEVIDPALHRRYRAIVGALGWLQQGTRPDIAHAVSQLSQFVQRPGEKHMRAAEHVLKYLSGTYTDGIYYGKDSQRLNKLWGWVDADFAADLDTRRSHTGYILMLNGGAVSWKSTKQKSVSLSTAEAEWYAASEAGKEIVYLRSILNDFGFEQVSPTLLYEDSRAVIAMAENPVNRKASRHIDTRKHFIGQLVEDKMIVLEQCATDRMVADALTKGLPAPAFEKHKAEMLGKTSNACSICVAFKMVYKKQIG
jgi:hypothetical protein